MADDRTTADTPVKLCECGCGAPAPIARYTDRNRGWVKGQPLRFINGHNAGSRPGVAQPTDGRCACGCGQMAPLAQSSRASLGYVRGQPMRYIAGHNSGPLRQRLLCRLIIDPSGCLLWTGSRYPDGYGQIMVGKKLRRVHRVMWEMFEGPIPEGLELDHVRALGCTNKHCASPAHLEPVTGAENKRRYREQKEMGAA